MQHAFMLARGLVGTALAGIGILGSESTPFFPRTEFSGVPSGGDFTRRFSFIGLRTFTVPISLTALVIFMAHMDMALARQEEGFAADEDVFSDHQAGADTAHLAVPKRIETSRMWNYQMRA